jgi:hypothetical protein
LQHIDFSLLDLKNLAFFVGLKAAPLTTIGSSRMRYCLRAHSRLRHVNKIRMNRLAIR